MLDPRLRKNLDWPLLALTFAVVTFGIAAIYSAARYSPAHFYEKQILWAGLGAAALLLLANMDYGRLSRARLPLYLANLVLLALVFPLARETKGAQRWIPLGSFNLQPSEFAKLLVILCLAGFLAARLGRITRGATLLQSFGYAALPMALIFKQPDLGTALVLAAVWAGIAYVAGTRVSHLLVFLLAGALLACGLWKSGLIKPYQKARLEAFADPAADPGGAGYQLRQSLIAIGSGEMLGKGFGQGTQVQGRLIPESHTDFIYTIVGEEGGFVASVALIGLYAGILYRGLRIMALAEDPYGRLVAAGIVSMYAFHVVVNIGMTLGLMPVTGVPLPLFSYGGSNLLLNMAAIGLLLSIGMRRHRLAF